LDEDRGRIAFHAFLPGRKGVHTVADDVPWRDLVVQLGLEPWRHQAAAWDDLHAGHDVVVATPTASGK